MSASSTPHDDGGGKLNNNDNNSTNTNNNSNNNITNNNNSNSNKAPATSSSSSKPSKLADRTVSRPSNAWIIYRSAYIAHLRTTQPQQLNDLSQADLSKFIASKWREEPAETKRHYAREAELRKENHVGSPVYKRPPRKSRSSNSNAARRSCHEGMLMLPGGNIVTYPMASNAASAPIVDYACSSSSSSMPLTPGSNYSAAQYQYFYQQQQQQQLQLQHNLQNNNNNTYNNANNNNDNMLQAQSPSDDMNPFRPSAPTSYPESLSPQSHSQSNSIPPYTPSLSPGSIDDSSSLPPSTSSSVADFISDRAFVNSLQITSLTKNPPFPNQYPESSFDALGTAWNAAPIAPQYSATEYDSRTNISTAFAPEHHHLHQPAPPPSTQQSQHPYPTSQSHHVQPFPLDSHHTPSNIYTTSQAECIQNQPPQSQQQQIYQQPQSRFVQYPPTTTPNDMSSIYKNR